MCVESAQGKLARIEWKIMREHLEVNRGILVPGKSYEAHLALLLRLRERLDGTTRRKMTLRVVVIDALVNLPEIKVISPQTPKRILELLHGDLLVASVRAELRHEERLVPPSAFESLAH